MWNLEKKKSKHSDSCNVVITPPYPMSHGFRNSVWWKKKSWSRFYPQKCCESVLLLPTCKGRCMNKVEIKSIILCQVWLVRTRRSWSSEGLNVTNVTDFLPPDLVDPPPDPMVFLGYLVLVWWSGKAKLSSPRIGWRSAFPVVAMCPTTVPATLLPSILWRESCFTRRSVEVAAETNS